MTVLRMICTALLMALLTGFGAVSYAQDSDDVEGGTIGTGIMGVVTGFGSVHIAGLQVEVPDGLQVTSRFGARDLDQIAVGQTVVIDAQARNGALWAQRIQAYYAVVAPVTQISADRMELLGLSLDITGVSAEGISAGDWVALSGLWQGNALSVSHIEPVTTREQVVVNASYSRNGKGAAQIGPFALAGPELGHAQVGDQLVVQGLWDSERAMLLPAQIDKPLFGGDGKRLLIEGYMSQPDATGTYYIHGAGVTFVTDDPAMQVPAARSLFCIDPQAPDSFTQVLQLDQSAAQRMTRLEALAINKEGSIAISTGCLR